MVYKTPNYCIDFENMRGWSRSGIEVSFAIKLDVDGRFIYRLDSSIDEFSWPRLFTENSAEWLALYDAYADYLFDEKYLLTEEV